MHAHQNPDAQDPRGAGRRVKTAVTLRRFAGTVAVLATATGGLSAFAAPADAAAGPTARLRHGTVTVTGTPARDVIGITVDADQLAVDFGLDGTIDGQFQMSRVQRLSVRAGEGNDGDAGHLIVDHELRDRINADNIEDVTWFGFGGLDESGSGDGVTVNDLSGNDVVNFTPNFSAPDDPTTPNNSADRLSVRATPGGDHIAVSGSGANITVAGLTPTVTPVLLNSADVVRIDTLDGNDTVDSSGLQPGLVQLQVL